ncbi:hypothetical protein AVEN_165337-1 [Araneus ventricosus]|uniref:Uncharacterized protein n=1 Tax=Araneus ventricosus TaxID=182803 RepID=A0A4Y2AV20_ARAVE|nr:hypothetical protein AVEN_165337-1 [Araneus ventricosus]
MCNRATGPFGLPHKPIVKYRHPPDDFFKLLRNPDKEDTSSFALSNLKELYPRSQDRNPSSPRHSHMSQEPAISKNEIKRILKKAQLKKVPGYDSIDFVILKEINNRILNLLHSYFNKCLQLNSFPAPLKKE